MTGDSPSVHDAEGNTVTENLRFYCVGAERDEEFHGVVTDILDPDWDVGVRVKVQFNDGIKDYMPCHRRDPDSEIFVCEEIVVVVND